MGLCSAFLATIGYACIGLFCAPFIGTWLKSAVMNFGGPSIPWWIYAYAFTAIALWFAYRKIDLSAKVLFWVMLCEAAIVVIFDVASFIHGSPEGSTGSLMTVPNFGSGTVGMALLFATGNFTGFEATVIYREEVRNPDKTIPRATYAAVLGIGLFYFIAAIAYVVCFGSDKIQELAAANPDGLFLIGLGQVTGKIIVDIATVLTVFSTFACLLSIQNVTTRYLYSLGVDGVLPKMLGKVHPKHKSPYLAAVVVSIAWGVMIAVFAFIGSDPNYLYPVFSGSGTFCVILIMFVATIAILFFMRRHKAEANASAWVTTIAPILAIIGMGIITIYAVMNFGALLGATGAKVVIFFIGVMCVGIAGIVLALYLKKNKPEVYEKIGRQEL